MIYFPHYQHIIISTLNNNEVSEKILSVMEPEKFLRIPFTIGKKPFQGVQNDNSFVFRRIINYGNSFLPTIDLKCKTKSHNQIEIHIVYRLRTFVKYFWLFWMIMVLFFAIMFLLAAATGEFHGEKYALFLPFGMLVFGYLLCIVPFNIEKNIAHKILLNILS